MIKKKKEKIEDLTEIVWNNFTKEDMVVIASHLRNWLDVIDVLMTRLPIAYTSRGEMFENEIYEILINTEDPNEIYEILINTEDPND